MFRLARFSLANRALIALVTLVIAGFGLFSMTQLKQELIPPIDLPQSQVVTVVPGASPEVMDEQVSLPISNALRDLDGVESVVATSSSSVSTVSVAYAYGTDADEFTASLNEALDSLEGTLPADAAPEVVGGSTSALPIMFLTASSEELSLAELTTQLEDVVVPRLESIDGVRAATVSGAETQRIVIAPDQAALAQLGISPTAISDALEANGMTLPLGSVSGDGTLMPVQASPSSRSTPCARSRSRRPRSRGWSCRSVTWHPSTSWPRSRPRSRARTAPRRSH